jgi:hypothetical protein
VSGLFQRVGFTVTEIQLGERPDAIVCLRAPESLLRIACEVRTLHSDENGAKRGSGSRKFRGNWLAIMDAAFDVLRTDGLAIPHCVVDFKDTRPGCFDGRRKSLVSELIDAGRFLRTTNLLAFPRPDRPALSQLLSRIRVLNSDGSGLRWWPTHLQAGSPEPMDDAIPCTRSKRASRRAAEPPATAAATGAGGCGYQHLGYRERTKTATSRLETIFGTLFTIIALCRDWKPKYSSGAISCNAAKKNSQKSLAFLGDVLIERLGD